ncbi:hypothetical protein A2U01_0110885, partial [Trifolium medium]|nr:hypothetical protein [Trifolium medium]
MHHQEKKNTRQEERGKDRPQ